MDEHTNYFEVNKETWNKKVEVHAKSEMYNLQALKDGKTSLNSYELSALENVEGKSLLHLQCHFGQDSMSLARMGAKVTAVDFSNLAIKMIHFY